MKRTFSLFLLFSIVGLPLTFAGPADKSPQLESQLQPLSKGKSCSPLFEKESLKQSSYRVLNELEQKLPGYFFERELGRSFWIDRVSSSGQVLAHLDFEYSQRDKAIGIGWVNIGSARQGGFNINLKRQGYSKLLLAKMFSTFPDAQSVESIMSEDNLSKMAEVLGQKEFNPQGLTKEQIEQAVKSTPFYKALKAFGFTEWDSESSQWGQHPHVVLLRK